MAMSTENPSSADQDLSARVVKALGDAGLLPAGRAERLRRLIAEGTATEEEWRQLARLVVGVSAEGAKP